MGGPAGCVVWIHVTLLLDLETEVDIQVCHLLYSKQIMALGLYSIQEKVRSVVMTITYMKLQK